MNITVRKILGWILWIACVVVSVVWLAPVFGDGIIPSVIAGAIGGAVGGLLQYFISGSKKCK